MKQKGLSNRMLLYLLLLVIPAMMIGCGLRWRRKPPKYPKHQDTVFGGIFFIDYRTEWAMKSIETWNYSHICYGRMMLPIGIVAMVFSIVGIILLPLMTAAKWLIVMDIIGISIPYFSIEKKLKQNFDQKGRWKEGL